MKVLSGGERTRLAMIRLLLEPVNLLILDEPTNHLDMQSKDVLKEAIRAFDGTAIIVSHDREFLDGLVTKVFEFGNQKVVEHIGGIYDFLKNKKVESMNEFLVATPSSIDKKNSEQAEISVKNENKWKYEQKKEQQKQFRKLEKKISDYENSISELESAVAILESQMSTPDGAGDVSLYEKHCRLKKSWILLWKNGIWFQWNWKN